MATLRTARRAQRAGDAELPHDPQPPSPPAVFVAGHADKSLTDHPIGSYNGPLMYGNANAMSAFQESQVISWKY